MFTTSAVFSSFSVEDIDAARCFYGDTLGLEAREGMMGNLEIRLANGARAFAYAKPDHTPATFTILNLVSEDLEKSVAELNARGVATTAPRAAAAGRAAIPNAPRHRLSSRGVHAWGPSAPGRLCRGARKDEPMISMLFGLDFLDADWLVRWFGPFILIGVASVVFVETGFIVLSFLPGDSLLFTVGLLTATGVVGVPIWATAAVIFVAAFAGDQLAYYIGRKAGPAVFARQQSRFFNPENVERTNAFFEKHGGKAIVMARFLPVFRAFVPVAAGVGRMRYPTFVTFNLVGAFLWGVGLTLVGYFLGQLDFVAEYAEYFVIAIVLISGIPILLELYKAGRSRFSTRGRGPADRIAEVVPDAVSSAD